MGGLAKRSLSPRAAQSLTSPKKARTDLQLDSAENDRGRISNEQVANNGSSEGDQHRLIIALDLDAFYVAACRKRDPSLIGLPIGIQQKAIVATVSYEARAHGVQKLASIKDALRQCPDLVLVNGEDLSYFRLISNQVWKLVKAIVWHGKVEKLGMDELFCDVSLPDLHMGR